MAAVDKLYGTSEQWIELHDWIMANCPQFEKYMNYYRPWDGGEGGHALSCFPEKADKFIWENCKIQWVIEQICQQYNIAIGESFPQDEADDEDYWICPICKTNVYWWSENCDEGHDIRDIIDYTNEIMQTVEKYKAELDRVAPFLALHGIDGYKMIWL